MVNRQQNFYIGIDAGTTSITGILFDEKAKIIKKKSVEIKQYYPKPGWVEHDPNEILNTCRKILIDLSRNRRVKAIGITNQRETTVIWNKKTGDPIHKAVVWQCRRTSDYCNKIKKDYSATIKNKTGLVTDAYFSASKINWLLNKYKKNHQDLLFGTIDTWLIWNLTGKKIHATDFTNASRTMLYNIKTKKWDKELLKIFKVPEFILPQVKNSKDDYGIWHNIPITGVAGDQQAALYGQQAYKAGQAKNTYGTGCFFLLNTGNKFIKSKYGLLTTLACDINGRPVYALEGSVFIAGALLKWLKDEMKLIKNYTDLRTVKLGIDDSVFMVPAFTGLGAPYWDSQARGIITGLTRGSNKNTIVRAALESIAWQTKDLIHAIEKDTQLKIKQVLVDGGVTCNSNLMQFQADILNKRIIKLQNIEATVLGAACLAGLKPGNSQINKKFIPNYHALNVQKCYIKWQKSVAKAIFDK